MTARTSVVLAAHGSRRDPTSAGLVERLAADLAGRRVADEVVVGFHLGEPGFTAALDRTTCSRVLVVPLFTSEGYYTETVLPAALARSARAQAIELYQTAPLGTHPGLTALIAQRIAEVAYGSGLDLSRTSILIAGHGTPRNQRSRRATVELAGALARTGIARDVRAGFLDDQPDIEAAAALPGESTLLVVPFLIGGGAHAADDLPRRLGIEGRLGLDVPLDRVAGGRRVIVDVPVGAYRALPDLLSELVTREVDSRDVMASGSAGSVALVGAGPGDPGLITVKGLALLRGADVVLHDRLTSAALLVEARRDADVIDVGKLPGGGGTSQEAINALLVARASQGRTVVRLKGGDPFVFGRGSEELDACQAAGIPCVVVPGISSAIAVPAAAGIPVTARGESRSFAVITARGEGGDMPVAVEQLAASTGIETLVLLMGRSVLPELAAALIAAGRDPDTPAACIQEGTTARQRVTAATLATLAEAVERDGLTSPVVTVVGAVAARAVGVVSC